MTWDIACLLWDRKGLLSGWGEGAAWTVRALGLRGLGPLRNFSSKVHFPLTPAARPLPRGADSRGVGSQGRARGQREAGGWPKAPVKERHPAGKEDLSASSGQRAPLRAGLQTH